MVSFLKVAHAHLKRLCSAVGIPCTTIKVNFLMIWFKTLYAFMTFFKCGYSISYWERCLKISHYDFTFAYFSLLAFLQFEAVLLGTCRLYIYLLSSWWIDHVIIVKRLSIAFCIHVSFVWYCSYNSFLLVNICKVTISFHCFTFNLSIFWCFRYSLVNGT